MSGFEKVIICIIWIILYCILYILCKKAKKYKVSYISILLLLIPMIIFNITGDYFNHIEMLNMMAYYNFDVTRFLELPYCWAAKVAMPSYGLWRLMVWGFGVLVIMLTLRNFKLLTPYYFSLFFVLIMVCFSAPRGYVASAVVMLGISVLYRYNNLKGLVLGIIILLLSILFHRQSVIMIVVLLFVYFYKPNVKSIVLLIVVGISLLSVIRGYIDEILLNIVVDKSDDSLMLQYSQKFQTYVGGDTSGINTAPGAFLTMIISYSIYLYTIAFYFRNFNTIKQNLSKIILYLFNISITFIVLSILIGIITGGFQAIAYRVLGLSLMPILFIVLMLEKEKLYPRYTSMAKIIFIIYQLWVLIYMIYNNLIKPTYSDTNIIM